MEGTPLTPIFDNKPNEKEALIWEHEGNRAVRKDNWKLVCKYPGDWELYDIEKNRTETDNVAAQYPEVVAELEGIHDAWAERCGVMPWSQMLPILQERWRRLIGR